MLGELICRVVAFVIGAVACFALMYVVYVCVVCAWLLAGDYWDLARGAVRARLPREARGQRHARGQSPGRHVSNQQEIQRQREQTNDVWYMVLCNAVVADHVQMQSLGLYRRIHRKNVYHENEIEEPDKLKRWARWGEAFGVMVFRSRHGYWRLPCTHGDSTQDEQDKHANLDQKVIDDMGDVHRLYHDPGRFEEIEAPDARNDTFCRVANLSDWSRDLSAGSACQVFKHLTEKSRTHRQIGFAFYNSDGQCYSVLTCLHGDTEIEESADIHWFCKNVLKHVLLL